MFFKGQFIGVSSSKNEAENTPVCMEDECIVIVKFLSFKFILLSSLIGHIVTKTPRKENLGIIMDIASYLDTEQENLMI